MEGEKGRKKQRKARGKRSKAKRWVVKDKRKEKKRAVLAPTQVLSWSAPP